MRLVVTVWVLGAAGCLAPAPDYDGTEFSCARDGLCPEGFECRDQVCVVPGSGGADGGLDAPPATALRHPITVDHAGGVGALVDFPILVPLDGTNIDLGLAGDGSTLRFTTETGDPLPYEIDHWEAGAGGAAWVLVPRIEPAAAGARLLLTYGDAGPLQAPDPEAVWASFAAVYHLEGLEDSSPSGFDGTDEGSSSAAAVIGRGRSFAGGGENIDLGQDRPFLRAQAAATVSAWVFIDEQFVPPGAVFATSIDAGGMPTNASRLQMLITDGNVFEGGARSLDEGNIITLAGPALPAGQWLHLAVVVDFAADRMELFVDGELVAGMGSLGLGPQSADSVSTQSVIGAGEDSTVDQFFGVIDDVRLIHRALEPDRIAAEGRTALGQMVTVGPGEPL